MRKRVLAGLAVGLVLTAAAFGHAVLLEVSPAPNAAIAGSDVAVQLRFNSRIDSSRSHLSLVFPDQSVRALALIAQPSSSLLCSRIGGLRSGAYRLRWQVLAADGHTTRGEVPFEVR
jgi:methionine-rich copper-binding protein CopC